VRAVADTDVILQDPATGLYGFRLEMGRDGNGIRMQARRTGFVTEKAAMVEYGRLRRQRDARHPRPRLSDTVQHLCESWLLAREQELQPNTRYNYAWLLGLIYPYLGGVRASRLSARMVEGRLPGPGGVRVFAHHVADTGSGSGQGVRGPDGPDAGRS
jgi:hypothetical protein